MSPENDDFISFEKALRDLKLQSEELKKLVSEGEIRAFRDGDSMKFRREDLDALAPADDELVFADSLEDDTGMVTEELSEEDTLLEDDDLLEEPPETPSRSAAPTGTSRGARVKAAAEDDKEAEPVWVTACAILGCVLLIYGFMIVYNIAMETPPNGLTAMFKPGE